MSGGQLTWRNIDAPNLSGGNDAFRTAALLLSKASEPLNSALGNFQDEARKAESARFQTNVLTSANPMTALQSGTALGGIDPTMLSQEALTFAAGEAGRRATVGNTLATTANTRASTDRTVQLTPLEVAAKTQQNAFEAQANPIKIGTMQTGLDATKLSLDQVREQKTIEDSARKDFARYAQSGELATPELTNAVVAGMISRGEDPRKIAQFQNLIKTNGNPVQGDSSALTFGAPSLASQGGTTNGTVPNPFNDPSKTAIKSYLPKMFGAEGGSKNGGMVPNAAGASSAFGPAQFTDNTWIDTVKENDPATYMRLGANRGAVLSLRTDQNYHRMMAEKFTEGNAKLIPQGVPINDGSLYAMHFFGRGAGPKVLAADASTPIEKIVDAGAIAANPFLKGMTAGQARDWAASTINKKGGAGPTVANAEAMQASQPSTSVAPTQKSYDALNTPIPTGTVNVLKKVDELTTLSNNLLQQAKVQSALNDPDASITKAMSEGNSNKSVLDTVEEIAKKAVGNKQLDSVFKDDAVSRTGVTNAVRHLVDNYGMSTSLAGAVVENSVTTYNKWWSPDYQSVDYSKLDAYASKFYDKNTKQPKQDALNKANEAVNGQKQVAEIENNVALFNKVIDANRRQLAQIETTEKATGITNPQKAKIENDLRSQLSTVQTELRKLTAKSKRTATTRQSLD